MALSVQEAKNLIQNAEVTVSQTWDDSVFLFFGGRIEAHLEIHLKIKNIANVFFDVTVPTQYLSEVSLDSIRVNSEPTPILECAMIEATADEIDTARFPLGYSNSHDQPEIMENWIAQPDLYLLSLVDYIPLIKDFIHKQVLAKYKLDLYYKSELLKSRVA